MLLGFFGSNLVLQSGWVRGRLAGKLTAQTRLSWTIAKASWSPWGGARLAGLRAEAERTGEIEFPPVFEIAEIRVQPYWRQLLAGSLRIRELRVTSPRGKVPVQLLAQLMVPGGPVGQVRVDMPEDQPGAQPQESTPGKQPGPGAGKPEETADAQKKAPKSAGGPQKQVPVPPGGRNEDVELVGRLFIEDGELQIYDLPDPERALVLSGLRAELPISGNEAAGWIETGGVRLGETSLAPKIRMPVSWERPVLHLAPMEFDWNGLRFRTLAALRVRDRVTGGVEIRGLPSKLEDQSLPGWPSLRVSAEHVEVLARWEGDLVRPGTWTGSLVGAVTGLRAQHTQRGDPVVFEKGFFAAALQGGVVQVPDMRLRGERLSLMGNGLALMDGRAAGVVRVVADPDYAEKLSLVATGSLISRGWTRSWLAPLETPDRYYRDIHLQGRFPTYLVDVGRKREPLEVGQAVRWVAAFVKREQREEGFKSVPAPEPNGEEAES